MIVHRNGLPLILCDGCFRPRPTGEPGWQVELGIFDARPARAPELGQRTVTQARQEAHTCPECATPYGRPLDDDAA